MRNLLEIFGPGVDDQLKESLQHWGFEQLTDVQQRALEAGVASGKSLVVCAPTSSGKTLVGEIAVLQALRRGHRCLYLVSHKALANQKYPGAEGYGLQSQWRLRLPYCSALSADCSAPIWWL